MEVLTTLSHLSLPALDGPAMSPEQAFVAASTRADEIGRTELTGLVTAGLDWAAVFVQADLQRVGPLVERAISQYAADLPADVRRQVTQSFAERSTRSLRLVSELLAVEAALSKEGVAMMAVKGPVLASLAYGDLSMREFLDLDILVHRDDYPAARRVLVSIGFGPQLTLPSHLEAQFLRRDSELDFIAPDRTFAVDVHWALAERYYAYNLDAFNPWATKRAVTLGGRSLFTPSREDMILMLALHGEKHAWDSLGLLADIDRTVREDSAPDWQYIIHTAGALRARRALLLALALASRVLGTPVPAEYLDQADSDATLRRLVSGGRAGRSRDRGRADLRRAVHHLRSRDGWTDRARFAMRRLLVPTLKDWKALPLPAGLSFAYYAVRPARLTGSALAVAGRGGGKLAAAAAAAAPVAARIGPGGRRLAALPGAERATLVSAACVLIVTALALRALPFSMVMRWSQRLSRRAARDHPAAQPERVLWAIRACSRRMPGMTCLVQALAGQVLLARAGQATELRLGVRREQGTLHAHAWLEQDGEVILGHLADSEFVPLG